jgi:hypothetical protein
VLLRLRYGIFTAPDLGQNKNKQNKTNHWLNMDHHNASSFTEFSVMHFVENWIPLLKHTIFNKFGSIWLIFLHLNIPWKVLFFRVLTTVMKSELNWLYWLFPLYVLNFKFQYTRVQTSLQFQLLDVIVK